MIGMLYLCQFLYSNEAKITVGRGRCIVRMVRAWTWCDQICGRYSTDFNKEMRDNVVELSDSVEDQNTQIRGAQECMLLFANQVDDLRDEVERHERNEQRFRAHENSRFSFIERRLDWIMTRLDIPQPQPDERW